MIIHLAPTPSSLSLSFAFFDNCPNFSSIWLLLRSTLKYMYIFCLCVCVYNSVISKITCLILLFIEMIHVCVCDFYYYYLVDPLCVTWSHGHIMTIHFILLLFLPFFLSFILSFFAGSFTQNNFQQTISSNNQNWVLCQKKIPRIVTCVYVYVRQNWPHW